MTFAEQLAALFRRTSVMDMAAIEASVRGRSRRSLFRDLAALDYLASYSHAGRFYALRAACPFDADGLWRYRDIGFSQHGTLKTTVEHLVVAADDGRTHEELGARLVVRVHNPLLELVRLGRLGRELLGGQFLYVAAEAERAQAQLACRRQRTTAGAPPAVPLPEPSVVIEVLLEVIHAAHVPADARQVATRLAARGVRVSEAQVEAVLQQHEIKKKTPASRSRRSPS